ncbi:T9SS C-terminal target domain-containing protein [bacterium]|nr:MAG: T9SS C-terminal target domain-containing protein [bacterium]
MIRNVLHRKQILLFLCLITSMALAQITRQPYQQIVTPNSITIRWDTQTSEVGTVHYGASVTSLTSTQSESSARTKHEITIVGLSPKQKYYYSVAGTTGGAFDQYFVTAPPTGSAQSTRIWVVSDFGQSNSTSDDTRRLQTVGFWKAFNNNDVHADVLLSLGDQSEEDTEAQLQANYFNQLQDVLKCTPLFTIAGNHEDTDGEVNYKADFTLPTRAEAGGSPSGTEDYYSFNFANIHFVALTVENNVSISGAQKTWLQNDLANNKSDWLIAYMHRPMHSAGYHPTDGDATALAQKANWLPLLEGAGVDLILSGHNHVYERSYLLDNLTGNSASITSANKIDTALGRIGIDHAYQKEPGRPHQGEIFISCQGGGTANDPKYLTVPLSFTPIVFKQSNNEGSLVIDVSGSNRMDVKFICDQPHLITLSHVWDSLTIIKAPKVSSVVGDRTLLPSDFSITNYPNPFNPSTKISYTLPQRGSVRISIYDLLGRTVATLVDGEQEKGTHTVDWSGKDERGNNLVSGMYIARLRAGEFIKNTKMLLLR